MNEHPIIFSGEMVQAILEGRKTQTRRVAKLTTAGHVKEPNGHRRWHPDDPEAIMACPYGQPGDSLWVRETWNYAQTAGYDRREDGGGIWYRATDEGQVEGPWKSPYHMKRWMSRIHLEIQSIRIERLWEISVRDCQFEGINYERLRVQRMMAMPQDYINAFAALWNEINAKRGFPWSSNPWVFVLEFEKV